MDIFEVLMGSGKNREEHQDYVNRYEQGPAWEGYSDQEVLDRYDSVAHKVSPREYEQATREAFDRLSPEERAEFSRYLEERARTRNIRIPGRETETAGGPGDLDWLSKVTGQIHQEPGVFRDMMGKMGKAQEAPSEGLGGLFSSPIAKAALAGIGAMLFKRLLSPR
jgi:hypothetical protein